MYRPCLLLATLMLFASVSPTTAQVPEYISYQGRLTDYSGNPTPDGYHSMDFAIYNDQYGGDLLWSESQGVEVHDGLFNVYLGSVEPLSAEVFNSDQTWLQINVDGYGIERQRLVTVPYAHHAAFADYVGSYDLSRIDETIYLLQNLVNGIQNVYSMCGEPPKEDDCLAREMTSFEQSILYDIRQWLWEGVYRCDTIKQAFLMPLVDSIFLNAEQDLNDRFFAIIVFPDSVPFFNNEVREHDLYRLSTSTNHILVQAEVHLAFGLSDKLKKWLWDILVDTVDKIVSDLPGVGMALKKIFDVVKHAAL